MNEIAPHRIRALLIGVVIVGILSGCGGTTYDYYNPLDPATAATVDEVLTVASLDPALAQAISDFWAPGTMKNEVNYVGAADYGVSSVAGIEFFPEIRELDLSGNPSLAGVDLSVLRRLPLLDSLILNRTIDPNIESLAGITATSIQVAENNIIYPDLVVLAGMGVRDVALTGSGSPSGSFYTLQGATVFEDLRDSGLAETAVDRVGVEYFNLLSSADLNGIEALAATNTLDLAFNSLEDPALLQPFFTASQNTGIQTDHDLSLYGNPINPTLLSGLGPYLQQLESLDLGGLPPHPVEGQVISITTGNTGVSETILRLSVADNPSLTDIEIINGLPNLEELIVSRTGVDDLDLFYSELPSLRFLAANGIGGGGLFTSVVGISTYPALETVYLRDNADLAIGVAELAQIAGLRELYLSGSFSVPPADIQAIIDVNAEVFIEYPDGSVYSGGQ
ncbi:MAG TPA: hypothetical protein VJ932_05395 [Alkalispirochaeta sp.]|nr:hypothetical protein [Alkalispirochaeta sp.]